MRALARHAVAYVIVGGVSARIQGAAMTTQDLDIMPEPSPENLGRLAAALSGPSTQKKTGPLDFTSHPTVDAMEFRTNVINSYSTAGGLVDVLMELPGVGAYDDVLRRARRYTIDDFTILAADIEDVITSKQATDRAKDWLAMPALHEARDRLRQAPDPYEIDRAALEVEPGSETDDS